MSPLTLAGCFLIAILGFFALLVALAAVGASLGADARETIEARLERRTAEAEIARAEAQVCCLPDPLEAIWRLPAVDPERSAR